MDSVVNDLGHAAFFGSKVLHYSVSGENEETKDAGFESNEITYIRIVSLSR